MAGRVAKRLPHPGVLPTGERDPSMVARVVNRLLEGKMNVVGEIKLASGVVETRVDNPLIGPQSFLLWQALDAAGATLIQTLWLKERGTRFAIFGHSAPGADTWIEYAVIS